MLCCVYPFSPRYLLVRHRSYAIGPHSDLLLVSFSDSEARTGRPNEMSRNASTFRMQYENSMAADRCQQVPRGIF